MIPPRVLGVVAAVIAPAWTRPESLRRLIERAPEGGHSTSPDRTRTALAASRGALRRLARLERVGGPWRDLCLHRSIAACLVLRRCGAPAVLRIGVRADAADLAAHAWVESPDGAALYGAPLGHVAMGGPEPSRLGRR